MFVGGLLSCSGQRINPRCCLAGVVYWLLFWRSQSYGVSCGGCCPSSRVVGFRLCSFLWLPGSTGCDWEACRSRPSCFVLRPLFPSRPVTGGCVERFRSPTLPYSCWIAGLRGLSAFWGFNVATNTPSRWIRVFVGDTARSSLSFFCRS